MTGQEKLPDGLECCFKALAKAVFSEEGTVYFHRTFISFDGSDRTRVITRYANTAMEKGGDIAVAARAVMIYPAIKWLLKAREIEAVIAALPEEAAQGDFCRLVGMQSMLVRLTGEKPEMRLQVRREFFERCQEFTDVVFKAVFSRKNFPRDTPRLAVGYLADEGVDDFLLGAAVQTDDGVILSSLWDPRNFVPPVRYIKKNIPAMFKPPVYKPKHTA